jgi:glycosyltransferase involved in cell wall biosynthesis
LDYCCGDVVISMDADLQHPPEVIPQMIQLWESGYDIVNTLKRNDKSQPLLRSFVNVCFYSFLSRLSGLELSGGQSDFRLMDRKAVDALKVLPERTRFLRGLTRWIGFQQVGIEYDVPPRFAGTTKFKLVHLLRFALDGILSFSIIPLRIFTGLGIVISSLALLYGAFIISFGLYTMISGNSDTTTPGWLVGGSGFATIGAAVFFFSGIQLIGIGLLGEYLGRVFDEVKKRPIYLVQDDSFDDRGTGRRSLNTTMLPGEAFSEFGNPDTDGM